ncbi:MAG: hypothetical protein CMF41_05895 [Legionellales bacterium]|nr:hypothetical protein [Legionellales bacterium]OUX64244.1 MAG: hypothetical protein CBE41_03510 [Gammaproteobacteria bacterium TMED281]
MDNMKLQPNQEFKNKYLDQFIKSIMPAIVSNLQTQKMEQRLQKFAVVEKKQQQTLNKPFGCAFVLTLQEQLELNLINHLRSRESMQNRLEDFKSDVKETHEERLEDHLEHIEAQTEVNDPTCFEILLLDGSDEELYNALGDVVEEFIALPESSQEYVVDTLTPKMDALADLETGGALSAIAQNTGLSPSFTKQITETTSKVQSLINVESLYNAVRDDISPKPETPTPKPE